MNAIILAGGRGTRLQPWHAPKTLLCLNGVPILYRLLWHVGKSIDNMVVCTGYRARDVESALKWVDWGELGCGSVECSCAGEDVSMGMRLLAARFRLDSINEYDDGRTLILYGDELADVNIAALVGKHESSHAFATFAAAEARVPGGAVYEDDDTVKIIDEAARWVNIGFVVVEPACWELLRPEDGLSDWINRVSEQHGRVSVYYHKGKRATVNSLADLEYAEKTWR